MTFLVRFSIIASLIFGLASAGYTAVTINTPMEIDRKVQINLIRTGTSDGTILSTIFGDATQRSYIESQINRVWSQAGIFVEFSTGFTTYLNTFAFDGSPGNYTSTVRPSADLSTIITQGDLNGVGSSNPQVIDAYFMKITPGFTLNSTTSTNGWAFVNNPGITFYVGEGMLSTEARMDSVAAVFAHELAHNLGLSHISDSTNLLNSTIFNGRLTSSQIATARSSSLLMAIPEPNRCLLLLSSLAFVIGFRNRSHF